MTSGKEQPLDSTHKRSPRKEDIPLGPNAGPGSGANQGVVAALTLLKKKTVPGWVRVRHYEGVGLEEFSSHVAMKGKGSVLFKGQERH